MSNRSWVLIYIACLLGNITGMILGFGIVLFR